MQLEDLESDQLGLHDGGLFLVSKSLQDLSEDSRRQADWLCARLEVEPLRFGISDAVEEVDPD